MPTQIIPGGVSSSGLSATSDNPIEVLGTALSATVFSGGTLTLYNGAVGEALTISSGGVLIGPGELLGGRYGALNSVGTVAAGAVSGVTLGDLGYSDFGKLEIQSGGSASGVVVVNGVLTIDAGASGSGALVSGIFGPEELVYGVASGDTVAGAGGDVSLEYVFGSGATNSDVLSSGGVEYVSGGSANSTTVSSGGRLWIYSGAAAIGGEILAGGSAGVTFGGSVTGLVVESAGTLSIDPGAEASGVLVESGGIVHANIVVSSGDEASIGQGPVVSTIAFGGITISSGGVLVAGVADVQSGGSLTLLSGATLQSAIVSAGGSAVLSAGAVAGAEVLADGALTGFGELTGAIPDAGIVSGVTLGDIVSGFLDVGALEVQSGGSADQVTVVNGSLTVDSGGSVSGAVVSGVGSLSGSIEYVFGSAVGTTVIGGGGYVGLTGYNALEYVLVGGVVSGDTLSSGGEEIVSSGGSTSGAVVSSGGSLIVSVGGSAAGIVVEDGGSIDFPAVIDGGVTLVAGLQTRTISLDGVIVSSGGRIGVDGGTVLNGGTLILAAGTKANGLTVSSGGKLLGPGELLNLSFNSPGVKAAGLVSGVTLGDTSPYYSDVGTLEILSGGSASGVSVNNGALTIDAGGIGAGTLLSGQNTLSAASEYVYGSALNTVLVGSGGNSAYEYVEAGGASFGDVISSGGAVRVSSGGSTSESVVDNGGQLIISGGTAAGAQVLSGGFVDFGGNISASVSISAGPVTALTSLGGVTISNGGVLSVDGAEVVNGGVLTLLSAVVASGLAISSGGTLSLASGAVAVGGFVSSGGDLVGPGELVGDPAAAGLVNGVMLGDPSSALNAADLELTSGGSASGVTVYKGALTIDAGATGSSAVISGVDNFYGASEYVFGVAVSTTIAGAAGFTAQEGVYAGGVTTHDMIRSGGTESVQGVTSAPQVSSGGSLDISAGGIAVGAVISYGGSAVDLYGGVEKTPTVLSGGSDDVSYGGVVEFGGTTVSAGKTLVAGPVVSTTVISSVTLSAGAIETFLNPTVLNGGTLVAANGAWIDQATVSSGGKLSGPGYLIGSSVAAGSVVGAAIGIASGITGGPQVGYLEVKPTGSANAVLVENGVMVVDGGGSTSNTQVESGGEEAVNAAGRVSGSVIDSGGVEKLSSGSIASNVIVNNGGLLILAGDTISSGATLYAETEVTSTLVNGISLMGGAQVNLLNTVVLKGGLETIRSGGLDSGAIVSSGGVVTVQSGGSALNLTVSGGGKIEVAAGAALGGVALTMGSVIELSDITATSASVNGSNQLVVTSGGTTLETIGLSGGASGLGLALTSDGSGGTLITVTSVSQTSNTAPPNAFDNAGLSDILWRNSNGDAGVWLTTSGGGYASVDFGVVPTAWQTAGAADFNGDGKADILWRNSNGDAGVWLSNAGNGYAGFTSVDFGVVATSWTIDGTGDFNGDGKADILWRNSNGDAGVWLSNPGAGYAGFTSVDFGVVASSWTIQGVGDFNGDGKSDILWRNSNGDAGVWLSNPGSGYTGYTSIDFGVVPSSWSIAGVGDFNGDGKADILWRNSNGDTGVWLSNSGSGYAGFTSVDFGVVPAGWSIEGVGDYNGDGKADILWRNSNGDTGEWLSNAGSGYAGFTSTDLGVVPAAWQIVDTTAPPASPSTALFTQAMASMVDPGAAAISTQAPATQPTHGVLAVVNSSVSSAVLS